MCTSSGTFDRNYKGGQTPEIGDVLEEKHDTSNPRALYLLVGIRKDGSLKMHGKDGDKFDASDFILVQRGDG